MPLQAILFDCDGVIADSEEWWNEIDREALALFGVPDYDGSLKEWVIGKSFTLSATFYRDHFGLSAPVEEIVEARTLIAQKFYAEKIPPFEGVPQVLQALRAQNLKIALATSSVSRLILPFLQRCELLSFFDAIITGEQVKNGKPHPDIYLLAAQKVETAPANCLVVEDALAGLQAGRAAEAKTVAIPDARWLDPALFEGAADFQIGKISELVALVERLGAGENVA